MSKLIVEMEMPRSCEFCHMAHWNKLDELTGCDAARGKRNVPDNDEFWNKGRPSWCPIKGVLPEQHGDLVDADTVLWEVPDSERIVPPMPVTIGDVIEGYDVPIVIAAERKDDDKDN